MENGAFSVEGFFLLRPSDRGVQAVVPVLMMNNDGEKRKARVVLAIDFEEMTTP